MSSRLVRLIALAVCMPLLAALAGESVSTDEGVSEIADCRVKLVDEVVLASAQSGILHTVAFKEGDFVRKDEVVAAIRDGIVRSALATAEIQAENDVEIRYAKKAADLARVAYQRSIQANKSLKGTIPENEVRELRLAAEKAILQVEQAEYHLSVAGLKRDEARELLSTFLVQAPFDATVTKVYKKRGEAVREGEPILELSNAARMRVEGWIPLQDAWRIRAGNPVSIRVVSAETAPTASAMADGPSPDNPQRLSDLHPRVRHMNFLGHVTLIDSKVEPVTQTVRIWAEVANRNDILKDGLTATMQIRRSARHDAESALTRRFRRGAPGPAPDLSSSLSSNAATPSER